MILCPNSGVITNGAQYLNTQSSRGSPQSGLGMRKVEFEQLLVAPGPFEQGLLAFAKCEPQVKVRSTSLMRLLRCSRLHLLLPPRRDQPGCDWPWNPVAFA